MFGLSDDQPPPPEEPHSESLNYHGLHCVPKGLVINNKRHYYRSENSKVFKSSLPELEAKTKYIFYYTTGTIKN